MSQEELVRYALPLLIIVFFAWRHLKFRLLRSKLPAMLEKGAVIVDVRSPAEFAAGSTPGSVNIPLGELGRRAGELDRARPVILCCASGTRSGMAAAILKRSGFSNVLNAGPWTNTMRQ